MPLVYLTEKEIACYIDRNKHLIIASEDFRSVYGNKETDEDIQEYKKRIDKLQACLKGEEGINDLSIRRLINGLNSIIINLEGIESDKEDRDKYIIEYEKLKGYLGE